MEANVAFYALHKFHWPPSKVCELSRQELAFIYAAIQKKNEDDEQRQKKLPKPKKSRKRRR